MDLSRFDTREAAGAGIDVPLVIAGETVLGDDGEPVTFRVRGVDCEEVHTAVLAATGKPGKTGAEVIANDMRVLRAAVVGWSDNFTVNGEKLSFSRDNLEKVMGIPEVRNSITPHVFARQRFFTKP